MFRSLFLFLGAFPFSHHPACCARFAAIVTALLALMPFSAVAQGNDLESALRIAQQKKIAQERQWRKLLHYEQQFLWTYSQIDSSNFFLAKDGDTNLESELEANIRGFWETKDLPEEKSLQCVFPARYKFLKKHLAPEMTQFPDRPCPRFEKYLAALQGNSVSLVFSSFYLNNPSSAFGHTFLRINKNPAADGKRYELLDYGINYAAEADTANALFYAIQGLFGFFPGRFTSVPYYMKVREYNNAESRDLWEYQLKSTPQTVDMLVAHVWELGQVYIDYWYLTENCSYHMLTVLEAADPTVDVVRKLKKWVIPSDTVKDVWNEEGLVTSFHFRPAVRTEFFKRIESLTEQETEELYQIVVKREFPKDFDQKSQEKRRDILDAAIDYMDFKFPHETQKAGPEADFKNKLLNLRSAVPLTTAPLKIEVPEREQPHAGHGSRRWSYGYRGSQQGHDAALFGVKYALHSRTDLVTGYPEYAAITFGDFQFGYSRLRNKVELEDFSLIEVISYSPLSMFNKAFSWRIKIGVEHMKDENCVGCHGGVISGGAGYTLGLADDPNISLFLGLRGGLWYTPTGTGNRFLPGLGPSTQLRVRWSDKLISTLEGWYRRDINATKQEFQEVNFTTQYSFNKNWSFQVSGTDVRYDRTVQGQLFYFY